MGLITTGNVRVVPEDGELGPVEREVTVWLSNDNEYLLYCSLNEKLTNYEEAYVRTKDKKPAFAVIYKKKMDRMNKLIGKLFE